MALTVMQKDKLDKLSIFEDGIFNADQRANVTPIPTIVLGIGGAGCKVVNKLKEKLIQTVNENDTVQFLAIDADQFDLQNCDKLGFDELLHLCEPADAAKFAAGADTFPEEIRRMMPPDEIVRKAGRYPGSGGRRQVGRVMLLAGSAYDRLGEKIYRCIEKAYAHNCYMGEPQQKIKIIIVAGTAGGTGGGTIVDIAYLVHRKIQVLGLEAQADVTGYLMTADVMAEDIGAAGHLDFYAAFYAAMKRNSYAALKEIDYYMNLSANGDRYVLDRGDGERYIACRDIFSECFIVTRGSTPGIRNLSEVAEKLSDHLALLFTDAHSMGMPMEESVLSRTNIAALSTWYTQNPDFNYFPRAANYRYRMLEHASVSIPVKDFQTYWAFEMLRNVDKELQSVYRVDSVMVDDVLRYSNIFEMHTLIEFGLYLSDETINRQPVLNDEMLPTRLEISEGRDWTRHDAKMLVCNETAKVLNGPYRARVVASIKEAIDQKLEAIFDEYGPYYVVELLTHRRNRDAPVNDNRPPFTGVLEYLLNLSHELMEMSYQEQNYEDSDEVRSEAERLRAEASRPLAAIFGRKIVREYADKITEIAMVTYFWGPYDEMLAKVIREVYTQLNEECRTKWQVYCDVLDNVRRVLEGDADHVTRLTELPGERKLLNLNAGGVKSEKILRYLRASKTEASVKRLREDIISSMKNHWEEWTENNNPCVFKADEEIRKILDTACRSQFGSDFTEKIIVAAYYPKTVEAEVIDDICRKNLPEKQEAIEAAAREISEMVNAQLNPFDGMKAGYCADSFNCRRYICAPGNPQAISHAFINRVMDPTSINIETGMDGVFCLSRIYEGVPLFVMAGISDYDREYARYSGNREVALHMYVQTMNWSKLANPYPVDMLARDRDLSEKNEDYQNLLKVKEMADRALDAELLTDEEQVHLGFIYKANMYDGFYTLADIVEEPQSEDEFRKFIQAVLFLNQNYAALKLRDLVSDPNSGYRTEKRELTCPLHDFKLTDLEGRGRNVAIGDFYKMLHMSMHYMEMIEDNLEKWEKARRIFEEEKAKM